MFRDGDARIDCRQHGLFGERAVRAFGQQHACGELFWREILLCDTLQVFRRRAFECLEVGVFAAPISTDDMKIAKLAREPRNAFAFKVLTRQEVGAGTFEFFIAHRTRTNAFDLTQARCDGRMGVALLNVHIDRKDTGVERGIGRAVNAVGEAFVFAYPSHQPTRFAFAEDERKQVEVGGVFFVEGGAWPGEVELGAFELAMQNYTAHRFLFGLAPPSAFLLPRFRVRELRFDLLRELLCIEVARGDDHHVVRGVPALPERRDLLAVEACNTFGGAQDRQAVAMLLEVLAKHSVTQDVPGRVFAPANFFEHDFDLAVDLNRIECRVANRVHQNVEPGAKCVAGKGCVIDRDVEGGVGVDAPARAFDFSGNLANPAAVRALEKHVLVKVRKPSFVCALVRAPDFGPDLQVDDRGKMTFAQQKRQAVGQDFVMYALFKRSQRGF